MKLRDTINHKLWTMNPPTALILGLLLTFHTGLWVKLKSLKRTKVLEEAVSPVNMLPPAWPDGFFFQTRDLMKVES